MADKWEVEGNLLKKRARVVQWVNMAAVCTLLAFSSWPAFSELRIDSRTDIFIRRSSQWKSSFFRINMVDLMRFKRCFSLYFLFFTCDYANTNLIPDVPRADHAGLPYWAWAACDDERIINLMLCCAFENSYAGKSYSNFTKHIFYLIFIIAPLSGTFVERVMRINLKL